MDLINLNQRDRVITEFQIALDLETFREVLDWLPSELRERIMDKSSIERVVERHPAVRWAVFMEEKDSDIAITSPNVRPEG